MPPGSVVLGHHSRYIADGTYKKRAQHKLGEATTHGGGEVLFSHPGEEKPVHEEHKRVGGLGYNHRKGYNQESFESSGGPDLFHTIAIL